MSWQIRTGDTRDVLPTLPEKSVQCVVTSPPYFALRDYGTAQWEGGDPECDHSLDRRGVNVPQSPKQKANVGSWTMASRDCPCGARRVDQQIGMETTPDEYVAALVQVFREVKRVLRDDGVVWLNIGDTYCGSGGFAPDSPVNVARREAIDAGVTHDGVFRLNQRQHERNLQRYTVKPGAGLKAKDLIGIPWMVAFALRDDGWYLRMDVIWHKPNSMPESVTDRPTRGHEYVFMLTKSARYFFDGYAIRMPMTQARLRQMEDEYGARLDEDLDDVEETPEAVRERMMDDHRARHPRVPMAKGANPDRHDGGDQNIAPTGFGANARSVWTIPTQPYHGAHFAAFPEYLAAQCIKAGTSMRGQCPKCGSPYAREEEPNATQWRPSCGCRAGEPVPQCVLDPFCGAGTTGLVADALDRDFIGIELNPLYVKIARDRIITARPLFTTELECGGAEASIKMPDAQSPETGTV